ncbi:MAG: cytochrome C [Thermodesulfobacteriota bacterium]
MDSGRFKAVFFFALAFLVLGLAVMSTRVRADGWEREDYEHKRGERGERGERREGEYAFSVPPKDSVYAMECGACHFLYLPGLLPEGSWVKLLDQKDHFGEDLALEKATRDSVLAYLKANSSDKQMSNEWSNKITRSLGTSVPVRITDVPYIARKHRKIRKEVFERPSVSTFSNCGACHVTGAKGDFEEDNVKIPRK